MLKLVPRSKSEKSLSSILMSLEMTRMAQGRQRWLISTVILHASEDNQISDKEVTNYNDN